MAKAFCLRHEQANELLKSLQSGELDLEKLVKERNSAVRRKMFADIVGETNGKELNARFEQALVSRQEKALTNWLKAATQIDTKIRGELSAKIKRLDKVLSPGEGEPFLEDLASAKLGANVTADEAERLTILATKVQELSETVDKTLGAPTNMKLGQARKDLYDYMGELMPDERLNWWDTFGGILKTTRATFDLSAPGRQGRAQAFNKEFASALGRQFKYLSSQKEYDNLAVSILGDPYYETAVKNKLAITAVENKFLKKEEAFALKWLNKLPGIKHAERAYVGFLTDLRFNRFKNTVEAYRLGGNELDGEAIKELAKTINTSTGRGELGSMEAAAKGLTRAIWTPRLMKSRLDVLAPVLNPKRFWRDIPAPARKEALKSYGSLALTTAMTGYALSLVPGVEFEGNPLSSNFGKLKIGGRTIDLTGGYGVTIRTAAQTLGRHYKDQKGAIKKLDSNKFGSKTTMDVLGGYFRSRSTPSLGITFDLLTGKDFLGRETRDGKWGFLGEKTLNYVLKNILPISTGEVKGYYEDFGPAGLLYLFPEMFGASVQSIESTSEQRGKLAVNAGLDNRGSLGKIFGTAPKLDTQTSKLLDKMIKEGVTINSPGTDTKIKPRGAKDSREMTSKEYARFSVIYKRKLGERLKQRQGRLMTSPKLTNEIDRLKDEVREEAKQELLKSIPGAR